MLRLRYELDGESRTVLLAGPEVRLGRSGDNEVVLPDYSVSRRHAALRPDGDVWFVYDLKSTNGVQLNQTDIQRAPIRDGDRLKIGIFEILVESGAPARVDPHAPTTTDAPAAPPPPPPPPPPHGLPDESVISNATIVRSLKDFSAHYGLDEDSSLVAQVRDAARDDKRKALDAAYATPAFRFLVYLARLLITAESVEQVFRHVMDVIFELLPVDRGFILLRDEKSGELRCELMRVHSRIEVLPTGDVPISKTMLESVMRERVTLLTYDALSDQRLAGTESVRIHQIRAAMCAPLWSGEKIIGVMQVDSPHHAGSFTEKDVDLLTTLANLCAVATERIQNGQKVNYERQVRSRLERYHSPGVIEEVMSEAETESGEEPLRRLKQAEASVLFADIVGFTAYSENADPEEVADLMEGYFTHAVEAIFSAGGTLDKFIGDCVMAFFGAPMRQDDHAARAVEAAVRIREALDDWNAEREARNIAPVRIRIGINSGPVVVGDIGSNRRVDYTVLGNTVNVASRLEESVAKAGDIVIGEATWKAIEDRYPTEDLGEVPLKGLTSKIRAYRVLRGEL